MSNTSQTQCPPCPSCQESTGQIGNGKDLKQEKSFMLDRKYGYDIHISFTEEGGRRATLEAHSSPDNGLRYGDLEPVLSSLGAHLQRVLDSIRAAHYQQDL